MLPGTPDEQRDGRGKDEQYQFPATVQGDIGRQVEAAAVVDMCDQAAFRVFLHA